jgi:hypothetical protein
MDEVAIVRLRFRHYEIIVAISGIKSPIYCTIQQPYAPPNLLNGNHLLFPITHHHCHAIPHNDAAMTSSIIRAVDSAALAASLCSSRWVMLLSCRRCGAGGYQQALSIIQHVSSKHQPPFLGAATANIMD